MARSPRAPLFRDTASLTTAFIASGVKRSVTFSNSKRRLYCNQRVLWFPQNLVKVIFVEALERYDHGQTAYKFRDEPVLDHIFRRQLQNQFVVVAVGVNRPRLLTAKADRPRRHPLLNDFFQTDKSPAKNEQNVRRIDLISSLCGLVRAPSG